MKKTLLAMSLFAGVAAGAQAVTVAGWDFSQFQGPGLLSTDGVTSTTSLSANYSALDPTQNAGSGSAAFGTLHFDGSLGSTLVNQATPSTTAFAPTTGSPQGTGSLESNLNGPGSEPGRNGFEAFPVLKAEGQTFQNHLSMTARSATDIVFEAKPDASAGVEGWGWSVSFGGKTFPSNGSPTTSDVGVEFSTDGSSYTLVDTVTLTGSDQKFTVDLDGVTNVASGKGYVRFSLDPSSGQPIIDNVSVDTIFLPEPGLAAQFASGAAGLAVLCLRRRRA